MFQPGFFDLDSRMRKIDANGNPITWLVCESDSASRVPFGKSCCLIFSIGCMVYRCIQSTTLSFCCNLTGN